MKNKIKTCLTMALISTLVLLCLSSCGMWKNDTDASKDATDVVDDVKDGANDVKDDIKDGMNDVKNDIKEMVPGVERGDQTGENGDPFTSDEKNLTDSDYSYNNSFGK